MRISLRSISDKIRAAMKRDNMRIRNAFKIAVANFSLVFKTLLFKAIAFALFALIIGLILNVRLKPVLDCAAGIWEEIKATFASAYAGQETSLVAVSDRLDKLTAYLSSNVGSLALTAVIIIISSYAFRFVSGVSDCALIILVSEYMTGLSRPHFIATIIENLKKILVYQLINALITLICDAVTVAVAIALAKVLLGVSALLSVFVVALTFVAVGALTRTVLSQIATNVLSGEGKTWALIVRGLKSEKGYFGKMYAEYLVLTVLILYFSLSVGVFTLGVGTLLFGPFAALLLACVKEVDYFTINKRKYFLHYDSIVVPKELRENDENLLNEVDI